MQVKIYAIYDVKAKAFNQPFFSPTRGTAIRSFVDAVNDPNTTFNKYPDDFTLFELGSFDDNSGKIQAHPSNEACGNALEYLTEERAEKPKLVSSKSK